MKKNDSKRTEEIRKIAYRIWLEAGKPDGDKLVSSFRDLIPLKELHWAEAEVEFDYGEDYLRSWEFYAK